MPWFRFVEGAIAGPNALGILIPPGNPTLVILRPRALNVDLLLIRQLENGSQEIRFWEIDRKEAREMGFQVHQALEAWATAGKGKIVVVRQPDREGCRIRVNMGTLTWLVCGRLPGQPYQAKTFTNEKDARNMVLWLAENLCPVTSDGRELYFNFHHFSSDAN
ncbi:MAG TPA: hypothetical protein VGY77_05140 [Gemmataceae bacterium]|jgi:hypothetical protein|nr:hypothetical protein [Gemmataceae bacterium]